MTVRLSPFPLLDFLNSFLDTACRFDTASKAENFQDSLRAHGIESVSVNYEAEEVWISGGVDVPGTFYNPAHTVVYYHRRSLWEDACPNLEE